MTTTPIATTAARNEWVRHAAVLQQWASQAEQDLLVSLQCLSDMEAGSIITDRGENNNDCGDCSASALLGSYWQSLTDHNLEMAQVSRSIAWTRALKSQSNQRSGGGGIPTSSSSHIKDTIHQCDAEIDLITNGYGAEGAVRASSALVAFIEMDTFRSEAYSLRGRQEREVRDAERRKEVWRVTELEVQRKLDHLRSTRGYGSIQEGRDVRGRNVGGATPSSLSCPLPLNPIPATANEHHPTQHIQPQHPNLREVLATAATSSRLTQPPPSHQQQHRDPTLSSTPAAVLAYEAFLERFPVERRASLGWEAEDHAVFMRCLLACDGGVSASPLHVSVPPPVTRPLRDISSYHSQQSNTGSAACMNGAEYWQIGTNSNSSTRRPIPLPCGAKPDLPYAVVPTPTSSSISDQEMNSQCVTNNTPAPPHGGGDVIQLCMRELPHIPLSDIHEHCSHYAHYTALHKAKRIAIDVFRANREASRQQEQAITYVQQERDVLEHQHSEAKREYKRLLRHAENKEKVEQWKSQKQQALRAKADAILLSHNGGTASSSTPHSMTISGHQAAAIERARHVGAGVQLMQCGRGFRDMTASELQVILRAHDCEDDVGPLCTVNRALLERLIAEKEDETRRRMQYERIQHRQDEIKGDVLEYKRVKEARRIVEDMREEEFLRMNGYPVPPKKYRASSSFATSGVTSHFPSSPSSVATPRARGSSSGLSAHGYSSPTHRTATTHITSTSTPLQRSLWEKDAAFLSKRTEQLNAKGRRSDNYLLSRNDRIRAKYESSGLKEKFDTVYGKRDFSMNHVGSPPQAADRKNVGGDRSPTTENKNEQQVIMQQARTPSLSLSRLTAPTKAWEQRERASQEEAALCKSKGLWSGTTHNNVGRKAAAGWMK